MKETEFAQLLSRYGVSVTEIADEFGLNPSTVSQWKCGSLKIKDSTFKLIKKVLEQKELIAFLNNKLVVYKDLLLNKN